MQNLKKSGIKRAIYELPAACKSAYGCLRVIAKVYQISFRANKMEASFRILFMYRRPTLYPLEIAVDFLKSL